MNIGNINVAALRLLNMIGLSISTMTTSPSKFDLSVDIPNFICDPQIKSLSNDCWFHTFSDYFFAFSIVTGSSATAFE